MMKSQRFFYPIVVALWIPIAWAIFVIIDVVVFDESRPTHWAARIFEDLVFVTSFLLYKSKGLWSYETSHPLWNFFESFTMQFFFWWALAYLTILVARKFNSKF